MRLRLLLMLWLAPCVLSGSAVRAAGCDAEGKIKFICGVIAPEDIIAVPRSNWVIASGYTAGGALHLERSGRVPRADPAGAGRCADHAVGTAPERDGRGADGDGPGESPREH